MYEAKKIYIYFFAHHLSASGRSPATQGMRNQQNRLYDKENRRFLLVEEFAKMLLWISWDLSLGI